MHEWHWTDTSLRYRHWRMCFERLLQAFAGWQPGNLFDIAAQPILDYRELIVIHNCPCEHSSKLQLSIRFTPSRCLDVRQDWYPMYYPEGMKARVSPVQSIEPHRIFGTHSGLEPWTSGSTVQSSNHYTTAAHSWNVLAAHWAAHCLHTKGKYCCTLLSHHHGALKIDEIRIVVVSLPLYISMLFYFNTDNDYSKLYDQLRDDQYDPDVVESPFVAPFAKRYRSKDTK